jgi:hypothetical protein
MAVGGHLDLYSDHNVSRINGRKSHPEQNDAGLTQIGQSVLKLSHLLCFSLLPFYGRENDGWEDSNAARILENSVVS